ncbi:MAG: dTMP kinase [Deltaproteobacteria bacterium]|nr:MAG: dTMP kinase [Deltaproteobacteria bacterium]
MRGSEGLFIVFEGVDGTGKSTQLQLLADFLRSKGLAVVTTCEPTHGQYGKRIRQLYTCRGDCTAEEELQLFLNDRKEHVDNLIVPSLAEGKVVLCDRYYLSTVAYQGALGFEKDELIQRNAFAPNPDIALVFFISIEEGQRRIERGRGEELNDFEQQEYLNRVAEIFASLDMPFIRRINACGSIAEVQDRVVQQILPVLSSRFLRADEL